MTLSQPPQTDSSRKKSLPPALHSWPDCGSFASLARHRKQGERACDTCRAFRSEYLKKRRQSIRDRVELPPQRNVSEHCGTVYGARQHREIFRESACDDCLKAEARYRKSRTRPPTMQVEVDFVVELLFSATDPVYRKIEKRYGEKKIQKLIADYESRQDARNDRVR